MSLIEAAKIIPQLEQCQRLLCVQPHPDDNEIGAGGTIAKLTAGGCTVAYLTVTDGRLGTKDTTLTPPQLAEVRRQEQAAAAKHLGVTDLRELRRQDGGCGAVEELADAIIDVVRDFRPEMVMTPDPWLPYEAHPDHRCVGLATAQACLFAGYPWFPARTKAADNAWEVGGIAFYHTCRPNTFIDVVNWYERKIAAISEHRSQFIPEMATAVGEFFKLQNEKYGSGQTGAAIETFKVLQPLHLHCLVSAVDL